MGFLGLLGATAIAFFCARPGYALTVDDVTAAGSQLLSGPVSSAILETIGFLSDHRPYEPATPLLSVPRDSKAGRAGLDMGVEATLVHLPDDFFNALTALGGSGNMSLRALPTLRLHLHKGLGESTDIGFSGILLNGNYMVGGDLKFVLSKPEEGPTWAIRFCYSQSKLDLASFGVTGLGALTVQGTNVGNINLVTHTQTYTPQLLLSKQMAFADPYMGIGYQYTTGQVEMPITINIPGVPAQTVTPTADGSAGGFLAFLGVGINVSGIKVTVEGAYSSTDVHSIGTKVSLDF